MVVRFQGGEAFYSPIPRSRALMALCVWFVTFISISHHHLCKTGRIEGDKCPSPKWKKALLKSFLLESRLLLWRKLWAYFTMVTFLLPLLKPQGDLFGPCENLVGYPEVKVIKFVYSLELYDQRNFSLSPWIPLSLQ